VQDPPNLYLNRAEIAITARRKGSVFSIIFQFLQSFVLISSSAYASNLEQGSRSTCSASVGGGWLFSTGVEYAAFYSIAPRESRTIAACLA
jgi:hypothetical protein